MKKCCKKNGFTLLELCIALVLVVPILFLVINIITVSTKATLDTEIELMVARQDTEFISKLNDSIRTATTAFTVPRDSFTKENLTAGWHYVGMMKNVNIPKSVSRTGEQTTADALVYLEHVGNTAPTTTPEGANIIQTEKDGVFIQHVLAHSYIDSNGIVHNYSLTFEPRDKNKTVIQDVNYKLISYTTDKDGKKIGKDGKAVDVSALLSGMNAIQFVYRGSDANPAVAMAFHPEFIPIAGTEISESAPIGTISLVLDMSASMYGVLNNGDTYRIDALKAAAKEFIEKVAKEQPGTYIILNTFGRIGNDKANYKNKNPRNQAYKLSKEEDKNALISEIDQLQPSGTTNVGDGLRVVNFNLKKFLASEEGKKVNKSSVKHFVVVMTDGEANVYSTHSQPERYDINNVPFFEDENAAFPNYIVSGGITYPESEGKLRDSYSGRLSRYTYYDYELPLGYNEIQPFLEKTVRQYIRNWGKKITKNFPNVEGYLISLDNGMSENDKKALIDALDIPKDKIPDRIFEVGSLPELNKAFDKITHDIEDVLWAFEGPRM